MRMNNDDWLILNVDDEGAIRYAKTRSLQRAGFRVIEARSGTEALECMAEHRPDLVLCDVKMPDMSGLEVCRRVKRDYPGTLMLQVSASFTSAEDRTLGLDEGADSYLTEPVAPGELVASVRALLRMKRAEDGLRALNEKLESEVALRTRERDRIWTVSPDLMAVVDRSGIIRLANPAWTRALGYPTEEIVGRPFADFVHEDDRRAVRAMSSASSGPGLPASATARALRGDGEPRWIAWVANSDGDRTYLLGRDISTERARAEELTAAQSQLRQSQKMEVVGQLTGGIAHDFNNLLTGILGSLDLIQRQVDPAQLPVIDRYLQTAHRSATRAASLTQRLLAFARQQVLAFGRIDVADLVESMRDLVQRSVGESVTLVIELADDLWDADSDANQLESALLNLALNARDAMPEGGTLTIAASNRVVTAGEAAAIDELEPGSYVRIAVTDTGTGMSPDVVERAFEPFFTTKAVGQGTGLGLSMIYGFVKQSKGHASIVSEKGVGTTIELLLPKFDRTDARADKSAEIALLSGETAGVALLVEDEEAVRELVADALRRIGLTVVEAADGDAAVVALQDMPRLDVLVSDIGLPGVDGTGVADATRERFPGARVLLMTGYARLARDKLTRSRPGTDLLEKPFTMQTLEQRVRLLLAGPAQGR
jgi:PAS domain S-box-containing protein